MAHDLADLTGREAATAWGRDYPCTHDGQRVFASPQQTRRVPACRLFCPAHGAGWVRSPLIG